jgi:succinate dehydrogenase / fumarate reductase cytochrome b subunit
VSDRTDTGGGADTGLDRIRAARQERGPVTRKNAGPVAWFDPRRRRLGQFAFSLNRITGLALVGYLYLHLAVLSQLLAGPSAWEGFLRRATTPVFLGLDVILIAALLTHGLNGLRVALIGSGYVPDKQKALWWALAVFGTILLIAAALDISGSR